MPIEQRPFTPITPDNIEDVFRFKPWNEEQIAAGRKVVDALIAAAIVALGVVPAGPDRSTGIRKLREARMDFNSAITHGGAF